MNENYHPGSTFKTIISFAGLESNAITPASTVFCGGGYTMGNHRWRCDKPEGHGSLGPQARALTVLRRLLLQRWATRVGLDANRGHGPAVRLRAAHRLDLDARSPHHPDSTDRKCLGERG